MATATMTAVGGSKVGPFSNPEWLVAFTGLMIAVGAGIRYILGRIDTSDVRIAAEREKLEAAFNARVDTLEAVVKNQRDDMHFLRTELGRYVRHVGILEGLLRAHKIEVPQLDIQPPTTR